MNGWGASIGAVLLCLVLAVFAWCSCAASDRDVLRVPPAHTNCCLPDDSDKKGDYLMVSTLDGDIVAFDSNEDGNIRWTFDSSPGPLLSSTLDQIELYEDDRSYRLIPSLDGNLYMYDEDYLRGIPLTAEKLLSSSHRLGSDVIAGGKDLRTYGIDALSGEVLYECGLDGCHNFLAPEIVATRQVLIVRRSAQTVRAVDGTTGSERWNVSVGQYEISYSSKSSPLEGVRCDRFRLCRPREPGDDGDYDQYVEVEDGDVPPPGQKPAVRVDFKFFPPDGIVVAYDADQPERILWEYQLKSPIAQLWRFSPATQSIAPLSMFDPSLVPSVAFHSYHKYPYAQHQTIPNHDSKSRGFGAGQSDSLIYVGTYNDEKYVIPSAAEIEQMKLLATDSPFARPDKARLYLLGSAESASSPNYGQIGQVGPGSEVGEPDPGCSPGSCPTCSTDQVNNLILRDRFSRDMGWYLYKHGGNQIATKSRRQIDAWGGPVRQRMIGYEELDVGFVDRYIWTYWREWIAFLVCLVVGGQLAVAYTFWRAHGSPVSKQISEERSKTDSSSGVVMVSVKSQASMSESDPDPLGQSASADYVSRFVSDFEPVRCLGRGGFGIVFESRNRMDDITYAVKRVPVVNRPSAKERVMREVKALAKLDHVGIVRYYQSWFECPPPGWQETTDESLLAKCEIKCDVSLLSSTPSGTSRLPNTSRLRHVLKSSDTLSDVKHPICGSPYVGDEPYADLTELIDRRLGLESPDLAGKLKNSAKIKNILKAEGGGESNVDGVDADRDSRMSLEDSFANGGLSVDLMSSDELSSSSSLSLATTSGDDSESDAESIGVVEEPLNDLISENNPWIGFRNRNDSKCSNRTLVPSESGKSLVAVGNKVAIDDDDDDFIVFEDSDDLVIGEKPTLLEVGRGEKFNDYNSKSSVSCQGDASSSMEIVFESSQTNDLYENNGNVSLSEFGTHKPKSAPQFALTTESVLNQNVDSDNECANEPNDNNDVPATSGDQNAVSLDITPELRLYRRHRRKKGGRVDNSLDANDSSMVAVGVGSDPLTETVFEDKELQTPVPRIYLYIQMQLCIDDTLRHWLAANNTPESREFEVITDWFRQIVSAVKYVHENEMIHRDLKPSNIFFAQDGHVKIGDFGLVTAMLPDYYQESASGEPGDLDLDGDTVSLSLRNEVGALSDRDLVRQLHTDQVGTHMYMSVEQISGKSYTHKVDVYSLGLIFFEMLVPFSTQMERVVTLTEVKKMKFPESFRASSPDKCSFVAWLLNPEPSLRPECSAILQSDLLRPGSGPKDTSFLDGSGDYCNVVETPAGSNKPIANSDKKDRHQSGVKERRDLWNAFGLRARLQRRSMSVEEAVSA